MRYLLALLLISSPLYGAALAPETKQELISDFSGGLNTTLPSHKLPTNFSPYMRNVFIDGGKIEGINGFVTLGSSRTLLKVTGIFPFILENGQTRFLVTDSSITLQTGDFRSWVFVSSGSTTSSLLNWMQVRNKMWGFNGVDFVRTWDGTSQAILNGDNNTPNVPKFKYGAYYQDRVWGFGIPGAASDLYFTSVITTDNIIIAPDDKRAWPSINNLKIGQGDGQIGTAMWVYQGQLRCGKERSIYTVFGDLPSNYAPRKEEADIGVASNDSVVVIDGKTHFLSRGEGIYSNVERISDLIDTDVEAFNSGTTGIVQNSWDTQGEFGKGNFYGSTATPEGYLTTISTTYGISQGPVGTDDFRYVSVASVLGPVEPASTILSPGTSFYGPYQLNFFTGVPSEKVGDTHRVFANKVILSNTENLNTCSLKFASVTIYNAGRDIQKSTVTTFTGSGNSNAQITFPSAWPIFEGYELNKSSMSIKIEGCGIEFNAFTASLKISFQNATTVQYISDIATNTTITAGSGFNSNHVTGGGAISYFVRTGTSPVNMSTRTWSAIAPGAVVNWPTHETYTQWAATIAAISTNPAITYVDKVTIEHIEGQASEARAFGISWKNRYWLAVTTTSDATQRLIYVRAKGSNAWMPVEGVPVSCFARAGDILYGGSVSTGVVYRLDYGSNFDGIAINRIYDTPDMVLGDTFFDKNIIKYTIDGDKSASGTMFLGTSANGGAYSWSSFSLAGTGRYSRIIEGVTRPVKTLRLRLQNMQTDVPFGVNSVSVFYQNTGVLSNK